MREKKVEVEICDVELGIPEELPDSDLNRRPFLTSISLVCPNMQVICGCGASFKQSGICIHQQRSDDPRCKKKFSNHGQMLDNSQNQPEIMDDHDIASENEPIGIKWKDFEVDSTGDFFGNYDDYTPEEFGLNPEEELEESVTHGLDIDSDEEEEGGDPLNLAKF
jgi:hypothetical protein